MSYLDPRLPEVLLPDWPGVHAAKRLRDLLVGVGPARHARWLEIAGDVEVAARHGSVGGPEDEHVVVLRAESDAAQPRAGAAHLPVAAFPANLPNRLDDS